MRCAGEVRRVRVRCDSEVCQGQVHGMLHAAVTIFALYVIGFVKRGHFVLSVNFKLVVVCTYVQV